MQVQPTGSKWMGTITMILLSAKCVLVSRGGIELVNVACTHCGSLMRPGSAALLVPAVMCFLPCSCRQLRMFLDEYPDIPYDTLCYTAGKQVIGGTGLCACPATACRQCHRLGHAPPPWIIVQRAQRAAAFQCAACSMVLQQGSCGSIQTQGAMLWAEHSLNP